MMQINLLPWRERRREAMRRAFVMQIVLAVVAAIFVVMAAHKLLTQRLARQEVINRTLEQHIADLNTRVAEVGQLRERQVAVRDRMRVIADLQKERAAVVRVFDELARSLPNEVYFLTLERAGDVILIEGVSESYAGITQLMRRLEDSEEFDNADLNDIATEASETVDESSLFIFNLRVELASAARGSDLMTDAQEGASNG
ncbi:MAG: PilN domain-containing protein [OM182 bacterium]|jgi:type IV pilus assembly protein PilN|nr:PilN domain-containing protein [Gammaproteobacteria bacterium]MDP4941431.1 PilN domain-containing protein [OM182 bacterium]